MPRELNPTGTRPPPGLALILLFGALLTTVGLVVATRIDQTTLNQAGEQALRLMALDHLSGLAEHALRLPLALDDTSLAEAVGRDLMHRHRDLVGLRIDLPTGASVALGRTQPAPWHRRTEVIATRHGIEALLESPNDGPTTLGTIEIHIDSSMTIPAPLPWTPWVVLLVSSAGLGFTFWFRHRLGRLCDGAIAIASGSFHQVPKLGGRDELAWSLGVLRTVGTVLAEQVDRVHGRNADLLRDATLAEDRLHRLDAFASTLLSPLQEHAVTDRLLESFAEETSAALALLFVTGSPDEPRRFRCVSVHGIGMPFDDPRIVAGCEATGLASLAIGSALQTLPELEPEHPWMSGRAVPLRGVAILPLRFRDRLEGMVLLAAREPWQSVDLEFMGDAAPPLAIALANRRAYEATVSLANALEARNDELVQQRDRLTVVDRIRSQFVANVSHELRTPLNAIIGYTELMADRCFGPITTEQERHLESVLESSEHLLRLVNQVLDLSRAEQDELEVDFAECDLFGVAERATRILQPLCRERPYELTLVGRSLRLTTDAERTHQILVNLLNNAIKFTPNGSVIVRVHPTPDGGAELVVEDTGVGIDAAHMELVFEAFRQVDGSSTRSHDGVGLGLAISRRLAQALGGSLCVRSEVGRGSTFTLSLPACPPEDRSSTHRNRACA